MSNDLVRVLRVLEYVGPREAVEQQLSRSLHGQKEYDHRLGKITIRASTIGEFPEILERAVYTPIKLEHAVCGQTSINIDTECEGVCQLPHGHSGLHDFGF